MVEKIKIYTAVVIYLIIVFCVKGWQTVVNSRILKKK